MVVTKKIFGEKSEDALGYNSITRWLKKFHSARTSKISEDKVSLKPRITKPYSEPNPQAFEKDLTSCIQRVSGEFSFSVICHLHHISKSKAVSHVTQILKIFYVSKFLTHRYNHSQSKLVQSAGAAEYIDCISGKG